MWTQIAKHKTSPRYIDFCLFLIINTPQELVDWMVEQGEAKSKEEALVLGQQLIEHHHIKPVFEEQEKFDTKGRKGPISIAVAQISTFCNIGAEILTSMQIGLVFSACILQLLFSLDILFLAYLFADKAIYKLALDWMMDVNSRLYSCKFFSEDSKLQIQNIFSSK